MVLLVVFIRTNLPPLLLRSVYNNMGKVFIPLTLSLSPPPLLIVYKRLVVRQG